MRACDDLSSAQALGSQYGEALLRHRLAVDEADRALVETISSLITPEDA